MLYNIAVSCDTECTFGHLCCTVLTLTVMLSIQEGVYAVHSIAITCGVECTGGCLCCTTSLLAVTLSVHLVICAVQY